MKLLLYLFLICFLQKYKILDAKSLGTVNEESQVKTPISIEVPSDKNSFQKIQDVNDPKVGSNDTCQSFECAQAAVEILQYMDHKVNPCDDFYEFACGNFLATAVLDGVPEVSKVASVSLDIDKKMISIIERPSQLNESRPFTMFKNLYNACKNRTAIEEKGLAPIMEILKKLGDWPVLEGDSWRDEDFDWKQSIYTLRKLGFRFNHFFKLGFSRDSQNSSKFVVVLDEPDFESPREFIVEGLSNKIMKDYYDYMVAIAVVFGANKSEAEEEMKQAIEFEMKLANISATTEERRNFTDQYNPMTLKELAGNYTSIPWEEYYNAIFKPYAEYSEDEVVIVVSPKFLKNFEKLIQETPKRIQANYVIWKTIEESVEHLTDEVRRKMLKYNEDWIPQNSSREEVCLKLVTDKMGLIHSTLFIREYFSNESKERVSEMISNIRQQAIKILQNVDWMDEKTRKNALKKAELMTSLVGYPDELLDDNKLEEYYEKVEITPGDFFHGILNISLFSMEHLFSMFKEPVHKSDWITIGSYCSLVNAYSSPPDNKITIPAGMIQDGFFNIDLPQYMNYGTIGDTIGHEISHGFDDQGSHFDERGNFVDWWDPKTKEKYLAKVKCIHDQYENYTFKEAGLKMNAFSSLGESIADISGTKLSYLAYQEWVNQNAPEPRLPGVNYSPSQLFWINSAQSNCAKYSTELYNDMLHSTHLPEEVRVWGAFSNIPEFSKDFHCPLGSKMNPVKKCSIW